MTHILQDLTHKIEGQINPKKEVSWVLGIIYPSGERGKTTSAGSFRETCRLFLNLFRAKVRLFCVPCAVSIISQGTASPSFVAAACATRFSLVLTKGPTQWNGKCPKRCIWGPQVKPCSRTTSRRCTTAGFHSQVSGGQWMMPSRLESCKFGVVSPKEITPWNPKPWGLMKNFQHPKLFHPLLEKMTWNKQHKRYLCTSQFFDRSQKSKLLTAVRVESASLFKIKISWGCVLRGLHFWWSALFNSSGRFNFNVPTSVNDVGYQDFS